MDAKSLMNTVIMFHYSERAVAILWEVFLMHNNAFYIYIYMRNAPFYAHNYFWLEHNIKRERFG